MQVALLLSKTSTAGHFSLFAIRIFKPQHVQTGVLVWLTDEKTPAQPM